MGLAHAMGVSTTISPTRSQLTQTVRFMTDRSLTPLLSQLSNPAGRGGDHTGRAAARTCERPGAWFGWCPSHRVRDAYRHCRVVERHDVPFAAISLHPEEPFAAKDQVENKARVYPPPVKAAKDRL
jgi:hypothetical protein